MEVVHQVKLLLRRNVALRLRQPVILALELLWPVAIFLVVMAARNSIPPVAQPTCHYKAWALPSAGVVPFVQSMICNIDECQNETEYEEIPSYKGSSVRELVANTMPLLMDQNITQLVDALPKGMRLMKVAVDALSGPDLSALLDDGFPISNLLKNTNQTRAALLAINLPIEDIDDLFDSSIQLPQILEFSSHSNVCDIDPHSNQQYQDIFEKFRRHLCSLDESIRKDLFRQLKSQLDVKNIVQTMGLAMSELGRLDIGEILGNVGGLLANLQSVKLFNEDSLKTMSLLLQEVKLDRIDTQVISLLIDDLEPLYEDSQWSPLIQVLKSIKLSSIKGKPSYSQDTRRADTFGRGIPDKSEDQAVASLKLFGSGDSSAQKQNSTDILKSVMDLVETSVDVIKFLPEQTELQVRSTLKFFPVLVDMAEELKNSLKKDNSTKFIDTLSEVLGAVFLSIADGIKSSDQKTSEIPAYKKFCDVKEYQKIVNSSEWEENHELQRYLCKISQINKKGLPSSLDTNTWSISLKKLQKVLEGDKYTDIHHNIQQWETEEKKTSDDKPFSKTTMAEGNIDDVITTFECGIQGVQGLFHKPESSQIENRPKNLSDLHQTISTEISHKMMNNQERLLLMGLTRAKEISKFLRYNPLLTDHSNNTGFGNILTEVYKLVNTAGGENLHNLPSTSEEFIRLIPAMIFVTTDFSTNATLKEGLPSLMSAFVQDLESYIWKSISPKMVEDFSMQSSSKHFCVDADALEATQLHWKWMLCADSKTAFKIPLPNKKASKMENATSAFNLQLDKVKTFNTQDFTRILLQLSSNFGFAIKVISQFLEPVMGCESTCASKDLMLKKICFLSRLQNAKSGIRSSMSHKNEDVLSDDDILKQLQSLVNIDEKVSSGYNTFMEVVRTSAVNNYTDWKDIAQLLVSGLRFLDSFEGHSFRPVLHVTNSLISLLKNRVSDAAQSTTSPMVEIQNVFPDSPLTQEVFKSLLPLLPEVTSTFFWTGLAPGKIVNLVKESKKNISVIMSNLCNSSLTEYLYNPALTSAEFDVLGEALCRHEYYDVFEEIFQDPDIQEIAFEVSSTMLKKHLLPYSESEQATSTDEVSWDDMHDNILEIVSLLRDLADVRKADISSFPPLTKWQKMATDIHSQAMNPSVMLYIFNNKLFFGFCNGSLSVPLSLKNFVAEDKVEDLFRVLCSMSNPDFAKRMVVQVTEILQNGDGPSSKSGLALAMQVWKGLVAIPEVNEISKVVLDLDLSSDGSSLDGTNMGSGVFRKRIMNATERVFDIVDFASEGRLSTAILGSYIPEVLEDLSSFIFQSDGIVNFDALFKNGSKSDQVLNAFLLNNPEKRRLESYLNTLVNYFLGDNENSRKLRNLCNGPRTPNNVNFSSMVCSHPPSKWSVGILSQHHQNLTKLWSQIDGFLSEDIKNATQKMYFHKRKAEFLKSIDKVLMSGIQVADWSNVQMSSFYFNMMRSLVRNLENVQNESALSGSCLTRSTEMAIRFSTNKLLDSIPDAEFLSCGLLGKNISELYSWFSKSSHLKTALEKVANGKKNGEKCRHSWKWLLFLIDDFEKLQKKLAKNLTKEDLIKYGNCLVNFRQSPVFSNLNAYANILQQTAKVLGSVNAPAGIWKGLKEQIVDKVSRHLPAFLKISEAIPEPLSLIKVGYETPEGEFIKSLQETSIDFSWLLRHGFSSLALRKAVCKFRDHQNPKVVLYPHPLASESRNKLTDFFCLNNHTRHLLEKMNQSAVLVKVKEVQEKEFFSGKWFQELADSSDILIELSSSLVSHLKEIQIQTPYDVFQLFMNPHIIQNIAESFEKLAIVLEPVFPASLLIETLEQIVDGLKALRSLTNLANFSFTYSAKEVFGEVAQDVLLDELQLDPQFVDSFLKTDINLRNIVTNKQTGKVTFCESAQDLSVLCSLSTNSRTAISTERLQDLVFQKFLISFGSLGVEGVLRTAEVDVQEAGRTLQVLSSAPAVVSRLTHHLETVTTLLHPEVGQLFHKISKDPDWLETPEALSMGGQILCGKPLTSLSQKFQLLAPEETENKVKERELQRLPTEFCRHGYKEIMKMRGGAILWGFLKPLFRGKILYSPKNYVPAQIIVAKVNETFRYLEEHMRFIKAAAEGTSGLHYLQRKNETLQSLQKLLSSRVVSKFLGSPSWGSALSWLESTPSTGSQSLLHLVELVGNVTQCISLDRFLGFDTEEELEAAAATLHDRREFIAALVFIEEGKNLEDVNKEKRWVEEQGRNTLPKNVLYKIRMDIDNVPTTEYLKYRWWRPYPYDDFFEDLRYFRGFLQLQDTVDSAITELQLESSSQREVVKKYLQQFPYPCHQRDKFGTLLKGSMPAVMTISWVFIVAFLVRERVLDRELELDETLGVMGLRRVSGWMAWFLTGLAVLLVSVVGIVAVLKWGGITPNSDPILLFLFVADFALLLVAYCQLMSTFFDRASTAALLSVLLYVLSFFPFLLFVTWELDFLYWQKLLSCCLVSTSFCFGCLYLNRYEDQGQGVHWSNLWQSPVAEDRMNFGTTLVAMVLCSIVYFFISWYVQRIITGFRGRKPLAWYAFFRPSSFSKEALENGKQNINAKNSIEGGLKSRDSNVEKRTVGISISNVHALYSKRGSMKWRALSGLNLDLYEDHITALLGHNGAGKTTTIKILTGRVQPTKGSVALYGFTVPQQLSEARKLIGFCPQNNTLYDKLTVKEHLNLFARLKGLLDEHSVKTDVNEMLERLNLVEKQDECSETLSGGQRRRLCVGIAFVGGSKVVILDEPTSSVDPVARRGIWELILSYKKGRTILFTTHHLDEADILSDRVAILHKGRMLCSGSPLELKSRFGSGYRLSLLPGAEKGEGEEKDSGRASSINDEQPNNVDCDGVMEFIQSYVPDATLLENDDSRLVVSLPAEPLTIKPLSEFFAHLEKCLGMWGFQSCSLSSATLEEVFLTLCRLEDAKAAHNSDKFTNLSPFRVKKPNEPICVQVNDEFCKKYDNSLVMDLKEQEPTKRSRFFSVVHLKYLQLLSLVKKRYWHTKRNWKALTSSIVMPCLFIALAMGLAVGRPQKAPDPSIELTPSLYSSKDHKGVSFFSFGDYKTGIGEELLKTLRANVSQGEVCDKSIASCQSYSGTLLKTGDRCLCERECPATTRNPATFLTSPHQILYNMSDINIPQYLLNSYLQFNEKRYGGWTIDRDDTELSSKIWFENSGYHSAPAYLNTLNNAILKKTRPELSIRTWSHPLRLSVEQLGRETLFHRLGEVGIAFVFLIGLSLVPCTFAVYIVGERESEQKRLQMVTGALGPFLYWTAAFLWDMSIVLLTSVVSAAIVSAFGLPAFYQRENFRAVYTLIFLYGWATTPLTYLCCRFFREGSLAFMVIFTSHLFVGLVIMLSLVSLRMISISKDVATTLSMLQRFSLVFPQYSLVGGLTDLNENQIRSEIFAQFGQDVYVSPFGWNSLGPNFVTLFVQGIVFFLFTVLLEVVPLRHWTERLLVTKRKQLIVEERREDDSMKPLLQIRNVSQVYHTKAGYRYAVDNLTLTIPQGDCFGLVGANGAGKTTLFRLLIGEIQPTSGQIISVGLQSKSREKHHFLGYCPQKDALDGLLTPRQHLEVYAGLRGTPASTVQKVVERSLQSLELEAHADCPVHTLSGGTKRKLCTAIATLGDPELVLLDEPTSGMDPATRRLVWKCLARATEAGRSVILTSHSIEDCDVLCSRLGIMVNGRIACLDSPVKLKTRLGTGYILSFRIPDGEKDWTSLLNFIHKEIPSAHLQVHSGRRIEIALPDENVPLSNLFCQLEECAKQYGIEDLALDPTTLDQVFVNFVRQQSDAVRKEIAAPENIVNVPSNDVYFEMISTKL